MTDFVDTKQDRLYSNIAEIDTVYGATDAENFLSSFSQQNLVQLENGLISAAGVVSGIKSQRVKIYTTWNNDTNAATTLVPFVTASQQ